jgi:polyribonucleotide nucleotidyltransferase
MGANQITLETGRLANQASGAVWVRSGDTVVLVTAVSQPLAQDKGFFPLTVEYKEMAYAAGRIPGSFFRREIGRPSEREVLVCRLIDRPTRPLFTKGFRDEVQIIASVLSADEYVDPDILAMNGASAALTVSDIPFEGPVAAGRVGYIDGSFVINPTYQQMDQSDLNLTIAATRDAVVMVEGSANFVPEKVVADAIAWGHEQILPLIDAQGELREAAGKEKIAVEPPEEDGELVGMVEELASRDLDEATSTQDKMERKEAKKAVEKKVMEELSERLAEEPERLARVPDIIRDMTKKMVRRRIKEQGVRIDGRDLKTVRPLAIEAGLLPRTHGSALFARGETKVLTVATLGSTRDEQRMDSLVGDATKRFLLHYNFPPYCTGEVKMMRGPSRREIGHGMLAERAITPILPDDEEFPFTLRVVSEVMESNGSSSMATVCGASLALMDAGVPVKASVAGVAMGLIKEDDEYLVLTDILGDEDALGDMDFKVAGSSEGVSAVQMDIKISGIPREILGRALEQAREARLHILEHMDDVLGKPRSEMSPYAPQLEILDINPDKIRDVIGPGGKNIKAITTATEASIDIEDSGKVYIFAPNAEAMEKAREMVLYYDQTPELGGNYEGKVTKVLDIGAVVEILPGVDGLVHISQLDTKHINQVTDVVKLGENMKVKVVEIEPNGRLRLSRKAVLMEERGEEVDLADFGKTPARKSGGGGGGRGGGGGGGRDRRGGGGRDRR